MQHLIRQVGRAPTFEEQIDIAQRRGKLSTRITSHQHRARQFLNLTEQEEDDQSYSYNDTHIFVEDDKGDIQLLALDSNKSKCREEAVEKPEAFLLGMPSNMGRETCVNRRLEVAVQAELLLREGQMNDALQAVQLAIGKKAFVFCTNIRSAKYKKVKTRAYTLIQSIDTTLRYHAQLYRRARAAVEILAVPGTGLLSRFQVLEPEDLKTTTTFLNPSITGVKHKHLAWFWSMDVETDSVDDNVMRECK